MRVRLKSFEELKHLCIYETDNDCEFSYGDGFSQYYEKKALNQVYEVVKKKNHFRTYYNVISDCEYACYILEEDHCEVLFDENILEDLFKI